MAHSAEGRVSARLLAVWRKASEFMTTVARTGDVSEAPGIGEPLALPDPDWLANRLTISGLSSTKARFRAAARGTNAAP